MCEKGILSLGYDNTFDSERIMQIEASKWFENDPDTARKIVRTISGETKQ